jgi:hypothetical protein
MATARFLQFDSVARLFARAAEETPLVVILDDLQGVMSRPSSCCSRPRDPRLEPPRRGHVPRLRAQPQGQVTEALGELARGGEHQLKGLNASDVGQYIELLTGIPPSSKSSIRSTPAPPNPVHDRVVRSLVENSQSVRARPLVRRDRFPTSGRRSRAGSRFSRWSASTSSAPPSGREFAEARSGTCGVDRRRRGGSRGSSRRVLGPTGGSGRYRCS